MNPTLRRGAVAVLVVLSAACSGRTSPTTSSTITTQTAATPPSNGTCEAVTRPCVSSIWRGDSTVVSVSATVNNCPVDHAVGQTRSVAWQIDENPSSASWILLQEYAGVDPQSGADYITDPRTPVYVAESQTGVHFAATAAQAVPR